MATYKRRDVEDTLTKKGFEPRKGDHRYYSLYVGSRETSIGTKISTGSGYDDLGDELIGKIRRQLHLQTAGDFRDFVECPLSYEGYVSLVSLDARRAPLGTKPRRFLGRRQNVIS